MNGLAEHFASQQKKSLALRSAPVRERKQKLKALKNWIINHQEEIQQAEYMDLAKPASEVDVTEIYPLLTEVRHAIMKLHTWVTPKPIPASMTFIGTKATIHYEPKGASLIISPWNYPMLLAIGPLISAVASGCTVTLKPSEFTPATNQVIGKMIGEIFSSDEVHMIEGEADTASELLKFPFDHIFFTGSPTVGKIVMSAAAKNLASVTLELGGKSPTIVDESANIKDAAEKITWGKWTNAGQTCIAPDYLFVHESKKDALLEEIKHQAFKMYGNKENYASIVNNRHFNRLNDAFKDAQSKGATVYSGGDLNEQNCVIAPTIMTDVNNDMKLLQEEIFGPILPVMTYQSLDEVISYINSRPKPLALYVYSKSRKNQKKIVQETSSGGVVINDNVLQFGHPNLPMGGVNNSGLGKAHGHEGFLAFSHPKSVLKQRIGLTMVKTVYPPYSSLKKKLIALMLKYF